MDNQKIINIAVLGCSDIARRSFIPAILKLKKKFKLIAIGSRNIEKAKQFSNQFNCIPIGSYDHLLDLEELDAIYVPLPTGLHREWIEKSLLKGLHVYSEKSLAMNNKDASYLVNLAKKESLALMEGYMFQFHSQHNLVKQLIFQESIGEIRFFNGAFCFPPLKKDNFKYDPEIGGGALIDTAGYPLKAAYMFLGDSLIVKASALYLSPEYQTNIWGSAFLVAQDNIGVSICFGFDNYYQCIYEILGTKGKISVTKAFTPKLNEKPIIHLESEEITEKIFADTDNHFIKSLEEFYEIVLNPDLRGSHYKEIKIQSKLQEDIRIMSGK